MLTRKLYISGLVFLLAAGGLAVVISIVVAVHDATSYYSLPEPYRLGIEKLQANWHYDGLPETQQAAILDQHRKWKSEEKLPWWGADRIVDPNEQKADTLANFEKFVPRWGFRVHQQRPFIAVLLSLLALAPAIIFVGTARWIVWLRASRTAAG